MATPRLTADTSLVVPALVQWHALHRQAAVALRDARRLPAPVLVEAFSVLTRLPPPRAVGPSLALRALQRAFPEEPWSLSPGGYLVAVRRLAAAELGGGRVYDAVIGATAAEAGVRLLTADRRALATYALVGVDVELIE